MQRPDLERDRAGATIRALKGNRTLDLLLTMETLCRLSYQGNPVNFTQSLPGGQFLRCPGASDHRDPRRWQVRDSNPRRQCQLIYSQLPLAARVTCLDGTLPVVPACARRADPWKRDLEQHTGAPSPARTMMPPTGHEDGHRLRPTRAGAIRTQEGLTMADSSFDIVSELDRQEVDNAVNQAVKEVRQRYDFRNTGTAITLCGDEILMVANAEERVLAVLDVLQSKLVRRGISLKALDVGEPKQSGKEVRLVAGLKEGISSEDAKKIAKLIRDEAPKSVKPRIQGEELRVSSKSRDDLQSVIALLKGKDLDIALQFTNYR